LSAFGAISMTQIFRSALLIDEQGRVISAASIGGHPLLQAAAVNAARHARFAPTLVDSKPVKVVGVIKYNFAMNE
jgi:Gram-negative bacterial TonB protein C-terminal